MIRSSKPLNKQLNKDTIKINAMQVNVRKLPENTVLSHRLQSLSYNLDTQLKRATQTKYDACMWVSTFSLRARTSMFFHNFFFFFCDKKESMQLFNVVAAMTNTMQRDCRGHGV